MTDSVFPLVLLLADRRCLVVGSGEEALRRSEQLLEAGADVLLVSESPCPRALELAEAGRLTLRRRAFDAADLDGAWLAVLTERDPELAAYLSSLTAQRQTFFCAVDQPRWGTFSHPAVARSGPVTISVSTSGAAPALARRLREELERLLRSADIPGFVARLVALRRHTPASQRREVLGRAVEGVHLTGKLELPGDDDSSAA